MDADWARSAAKALRGGSPTSQALTLGLLAAGREDSDLNRCLERDLKAANICLTEGDFLEGVRAVIIDKDRNPKWKIRATV